MKSRYKLTVNGKVICDPNDVKPKQHQFDKPAKPKQTKKKHQPSANRRRNRARRKAYEKDEQARIGIKCSECLVDSWEENLIEDDGRCSICHGLA